MVRGRYDVCRRGRHRTPAPDITHARADGVNRAREGVCHTPQRQDPFRAAGLAGGAFAASIVGQADVCRPVATTPVARRPRAGGRAGHQPGQPPARESGRGCSGSPSTTPVVPLPPTTLHPATGRSSVLPTPPHPTPSRHRRESPPAAHHTLPRPPMATDGGAPPGRSIPLRYGRAPPRYPEPKGVSAVATPTGEASPAMVDRSTGFWRKCVAPSRSDACRLSSSG